MIDTVALSSSILSLSSSSGGWQAVAVALATGADPTTAVLVWLISLGPWGIAIALAGFTFYKTMYKPGKAKLTTLSIKADKLMDDVQLFMDDSRKKNELYMKTHEAYQKDVPALAHTLNAMSESVEHMTKEYADLASEVAHLANKDDGNLSDAQLRNLIMVYTGKVMAETMLWWIDRVRANGIQTNTTRVKEAYRTKKNSVVDKYMSELAMWRHGGISLDRWGEDGIVNMIEVVFKGLYDRQAMIAQDRKDEQRINQDTAAWLQHRVSYIQGACNAWITTRTKLADYSLHHPLDTDSNIDWLTNTDPV